MKYAGWGVWIKPEITLHDVMVICDLARAASLVSAFRRIKYLKKIIAQVTTLNKVRFWQAFRVKSILRAADLYGGKRTEYDPIEKINAFAYWLAPRVGMSPHDILHQLNSESLHRFAHEALGYRVHKESLLAMAQTLPTKYFEEIQKLYDYKRAEARLLRNREIEETEEDPDLSPINVLSHAFDGGFHG